jgi:hypothetical protein
VSESDGDPVAWLLIEPGWRVVDADGGELGRVDEVVGDTANDIFNGLAVLSGLLGRPVYVPAEQVREITDGEIRLSIGTDQALELGAFEG